MWPSKQITRSNGVNRYTPNLTGRRLTRFVNYSLPFILSSFCHLSFLSSIRANNKQGKCPLSGELGIPAESQPTLESTTTSRVTSTPPSQLCCYCNFTFEHVTSWHFASPFSLSRRATANASTPLLRDNNAAEIAQPKTVYFLVRISLFTLRRLSLAALQPRTGFVQKLYNGKTVRPVSLGLGCPKLNPTTHLVPRVISRKTCRNIAMLYMEVCVENSIRNI